MSRFAGYRLCKKFCALRENLKRWNREVIGQMDVFGESLVKIVEDLDKASETPELRPNEITVRQDAPWSTWEFN